MNIEEMQLQDELTAEQKAAFFGQITKALMELVDKDEKPFKMSIHPRLFEQLFPAEVRFTGRPTQCFTVPTYPVPGVPYGQFVFETRKSGIIRGH